MLELAKAEWYETLKNFDVEIIRETIGDVKKQMGGNGFPSIQEFYAIANIKARRRREDAEDAARKREQVLGIGNSDPEVARCAREKIRELLKEKIINSDETKNSR